MSKDTDIKLLMAQGLEVMEFGNKIRYVEEKWRRIDARRNSLIRRLDKAAQAIYTTTPEDVAKDISKLLMDAAEELKQDY